MPTVAQTGAAARRGRPRSAGIDDAVRRAVLDLLGEGGAAAVTIDAVASRAGVARTTVYRRWATKGDLMVDAVGSLYAPVEPLVGDDLRADVQRFLDAMRATLDGSELGRLLPRLLVEDLDEECASRFREQVVGPRRAVLLERLERAVESGDLPAGTDTAALADALVGPVIWRHVARSVFGPMGEDYAERLIATVLPVPGAHPNG